MKKLSLGKQIAYAFGMMGWSIMMNLISVVLVYLYLPPSSSGIPKIITQVTVFGIFNVIAILTASGRLIDAFYDPFIGQFSDRSTNPKGRRMPIMKLAIIPSVLFCFMVFFPIQQKESSWNIIWLAIMLIGFYIASTSYIIPYNALLPELAPTSSDKVKLASWQSVGYIIGLGIASNGFNVSDLVHTYFCTGTKITCLQISIGMLSILAGVCMLMPILAIEEKEYTSSKPSSVPMKEAIKQALTNKSFLLFIIADFSYFISATFITSGLIYFITVLLQLQELMVHKIMIGLVLLSLLFFPLVNSVAKKFGKKNVVVFSFALLAIIFLGIYYLGKISLDPIVQICILISFAAVPMAALSILPNAILAEIIQQDRSETDQSKGAIYFAVRYFFVKIAQTVGIGLFGMFLIYGKEIGNDFGIRLSGLVGFLLCFIAMLVFSRYKENKYEETEQIDPTRYFKSI